MLVRKKCVVQKLFKIDENVGMDIETLAQLTGRSQNDLVNVAIMELLQDNKYYFLDVAVLEYFQHQFENANEVLEPFEMGGLRVEVKYSDDGIKVRSIISGDDGNVDDYTRKFESDISNDFENYLISLSGYIDPLSEDVSKYLAERTDYCDYIRKRIDL